MRAGLDTDIQSMCRPLSKGSHADRLFLIDGHIKRLRCMQAWQTSYREDT
jgi:hypothetical protein